MRARSAGASWAAASARLYALHRATSYTRMLGRKRWMSTPPVGHSVSRRRDSTSDFDLTTITWQWARGKIKIKMRNEFVFLLTRRKYDDILLLYMW